MSEIKFACPVCGQHITCDSARSGKQVGCPTCFQKLIIPHAPQGDASKLVLNASLASSWRFQPDETKIQTAANTRSTSRSLPVTVVFLVVLICVAGALSTFRGEIFKGFGENDKLNSSGGDTNWTLNLAGVAIPPTTASGRIGGRSFTLQRSVLRGGTLDLRQGADLPPEVGLTINLFARRGEDLARQSINIEATRSNAPKAILRFRNEQGQIIAQPLFHGYALKLDFGQVTNSYLPGKIYFCAPDAMKSWVAGTFEAKIRRPPPPKFRPPARRDRIVN